jgi:hypothetical protein
VPLVPEQNDWPLTRTSFLMDPTLLMLGAAWSGAWQEIPGMTYNDNLWISKFWLIIRYLSSYSVLKVEQW